jgi:hypothetical protein
MFKNDISGPNSMICVCAGLITGLLLFPDLSFQNSILVGGLFNSHSFPTWISSSLLFWSFVSATLIPLFMIVVLGSKKQKFQFKKIKVLITELK